MADKGFVKTYSRNGVQCFGIESFENLKVYLKEKVNKFEGLIYEFPMAEKLFKIMEDKWRG